MKRLVTRDLTVGCYVPRIGSVEKITNVYGDVYDVTFKNNVTGLRVWRLQGHSTFEVSPLSVQLSR